MRNFQPLRRLPHYSRALGFLALPALLFYLLVTISALPGVPGIFIESITASLSPGVAQVRIGYFGICIRRTGTDADIALKCMSSRKAFNDMLLSSSSNGTSDMTGKLLLLSSSIRSSVFAGSPAIFPGAGLLFLMSLLILIPLEVIARPPRKLRPSTVLMLNHLIISGFWLSVAWSFAAAVSVVQAFRAQQELLSFDGFDGISVQLSVVVQVLQWTAFAFSLLFAGGVTALRVSKIGRAPSPDELEHKHSFPVELPSAAI